MQTGVSLIFKARKKPATRYVLIYRRSLLNSFLPLFKLLGKCHLKYVCLDKTLSTEAILFHRGRNQIYSYHCSLGRPLGPQGCQKKGMETFRGQ